MKRLLILVIAMFIIGTFLCGQEVYDVKKPDASSHWRQNTTKEIIWDKKGDNSPVIKIRLYNAARTVKILNITTINDPNIEKFDWKIPVDIDPGQYTIFVRNQPNTKWGWSKVFEITPALIAGINRDVIEKVKTKPTFKPPLGFMAPVVESFLPVPLGALTPGVQLFVRGKNFLPQKGKIFLKGNFPGGYVELTNIVWLSNDKANGIIPQSANGQPNQIVSVVVANKYGIKSKPFGSAQFKGREEKVLTADAVSVTHCGDDGNCNTCNQTGSCDDQFVAGCNSQYAICGEHINNWGTVGDDKGHDSFSINLKNGWVFKSIQVVKWHKSSGDETLSGPSPAFPIGSSSWNPVINWVVSPNDNVRYEFKIIVEGPIGTHYK